MKYIIEFLFISILGTILHFTYQKSHKNILVGLISAKNESTWEHIKIALTPYFVFLLLEIPFNYQLPNFIFAKFIELATIILTIPFLFYGYQKFLKKDIPIFDIAIFYISILLAIFLEYLIINLKACSFLINYLSLLSILAIFIYYLLTNFLIPKSFIFKH